MPDIVLQDGVLSVPQPTVIYKPATIDDIDPNIITTLNERITLDKQDIDAMTAELKTRQDSYNANVAKRDAIVAQFPQLVSVPQPNVPVTP